MPRIESKTTKDEQDENSSGKESKIDQKNSSCEAISQDIEQTPRLKRIRERRVQDVVRSVAIWRRLYNGVMREGDVLIRYTLEDAAKKIGISKKTLDDYLYLIRLGRLYKFDFKECKNSKVGVLRKHIRTNRNQETKL